VNAVKQEYILELKGIEKTFPGVKALDGVDFKLRRQSVHALLGENGAGKSTLMKVLSGVYALEKGEIFLNGSPVEFSNTKESQQRGIAIIHQELNLCWNLSVAENIMLCHETLGKFNLYKKRENEQRAYKILQELDVAYIDPKVLVSTLSIANQQMVEIAKAISIDAKILIMDEPTSSLTEKEEKILFALIHKLKEQGLSIIYISHKLDEIFKVCDEVTILRDGQWIDTFPIEHASKARIIENMVGRPVEQIYPARSAPLGENIRLDVRNLSHHGLLSDITFTIRSGEILGISGLVGAGRSEMANAIFGMIEKHSGTTIIDGEEVAIATPEDAIAAGLAFVTEDRKQEGLFLNHSVQDNILSANLSEVERRLGFVNSKKESELAELGVKRLDVKPPALHTLVKSLSGGNQQKVIIARWLTKEVKILILDEPTRGIDVGAKQAIYKIMRDLTKQGIAILMISSELPEILGMSDRIAVMKGGRILQILDKEEASQQKIMTIITEG
jgi:ABC-type sugar transport system ATPase subunit